MKRMKLERIKMLVDTHNRDINIEQMMYSAMQTHKTVALKVTMGPVLVNMFSLSLRMRCVHFLKFINKSTCVSGSCFSC